MKIDANLFRDIEARLGMSTTREAAPTPVGSGTTGFIRTLSQALNDVNRIQLQSTQNLSSSIQGQGPPLHQVMTEAEEASLAFQMTLQFRNKALEAYQEIARMQF